MRALPKPCPPRPAVKPAAPPSHGRGLALGLILTALLACSNKGDSFVVVHADVDCDVPRVFQLRIVISNGSSADQACFPDAPTVELGFPSTFVLVLPARRSGALDIAAAALDDTGQVVGQGSASGTLEVGARLDLDLHLARAQVICGDGVVGQGEQCDDGNLTSGDGCSADCQREGAAEAVDGGPASDGGVRDATRDATRDTTTAGPYLQVAVGNDFTCAVRTDATLWCWGSNQFGQLRLDGSSNRLTPASVNGTAWRAVSCGQSHACALRTDGTLSCWGNNTAGQLGSASAGTQGQTELGGSAWTGVAAGSYHTCALKGDGTLACWGDNSDGQLGIGSLFDQSAPAPLTGSDFASVSSGYLHVCATKRDDGLSCWGLNANGQTGTPLDSYQLAPVPIAGTDWTAVTTGNYHSCALERDHSLWCWGGNMSGQLGTASVDSDPASFSAAPVRVDGSWQSVSAGQSHTCAVTLDGALWCWGDNTNGQLGTGVLSSTTTPVQVQSSVLAWAQVAAGIGHTCAVDVDGYVWCWGSNTSGQLGIGNTLSQSIPVKVAR